MTTWLDLSKPFKRNDYVELKEMPGVKWLVAEIYDIELESSDLDFHRKWDNNNYDKHDGLKISKK